MSQPIYFSSYQPSRYAPPQHAPGPPSPKHIRRQRRRRRLVAFVILVFVIVVGIHIGFAKVAEARARQKALNQQMIAKEKAQNLEALPGQINNILSANSQIDMSVSIIDNATGKLTQFGDGTTFDSASVGKLITATDFFHQAETGQESLEETINDNSAEYEIQQMIVQSDDDAWVALNNELGYSELQGYASQIGINDYDSTADTLTSNDIALLLQKLYAGQLLNQSDTQTLLGYMKQANYRNFIVPAVPTSDTIYHKVGLVDDNVHDAGIITNGTDSLELVIFTNGNGVYDWDTRAQIMQQITKDVLNAYFVGQP